MQRCSCPIHLPFLVMAGHLSYLSNLRLSLDAFEYMRIFVKGFEWLRWWALQIRWFMLPTGLSLRGGNDNRACCPKAGRSYCGY